MTAADAGVERILDVPAVLGTFRASLDFGGIDASPDGATVAFAWNVDGSYELYEARVDGGEPERLTRTVEGGRCLRPRYSPHGEHLAFLRDVDGDERFHLWILDRAAGEARQLTTSAANREAHEWLPDGSGLVCRAHVAGHLGIWLVDLVTGAERCLADDVRDPGSDHITPVISPDGRWVAYHEADWADPGNVVLRIVGTDRGAWPRTLLTHAGRNRAVLPKWSPDGGALAFTTDVRGRTEVALLPMHDGLHGGVVTFLTEHPHDEALLGWCRSGRLLVRRSVESSVELHRHDPTTGAHDVVVTDVGVCYSAAEAGDAVAYVWTSPVSPQDLFTWAPATASTRRTTSLPADLDATALVMPEHVWYPGADDVPIPALLYRPPTPVAGARSPAIVWAHGGGTWQHLRNWDPIPQWLARHGYVVLAPNARGSRGYGRAFREGNVRDWGGKDLDDHVRGADWLEASGNADGARIGIYGSSGGGYMTAIAVTCAPERWAAGVTSCGIVSLETFYRSTRADLRGMVESYLGSPDEVPELFRERSPLTHLHRIRAPLLVLHGGTDPRVPATEATLLTEELARLDKEHELHIYPDEGHGFRSLENQADALRRIVAWFDHHLGA